MIILAMTMILIFILGMFAFGSSILLCLLGILLSTGLLLMKLNLLPINNLSEKNMNIIRICLVTFIFIIGANTGVTSVEGGINAYEVSIEDVMTLIEKDKLDEAWEEINLIKDLYGNSDNTVMLEVLAYLGEGSYDSALSTMNAYSDRTSIEYYSWLETIYLVDGSKNSDNLGRLYIEAASNHPSWTYMQLMAGITLISYNDFARAEYLLLRAYEQEPANYKTAYYLGVTCYEQRRLDDAVQFFQESIDREPDDEILSYIAWYLQEMGE